MKPKQQLHTKNEDLFRTRLENIVNLKHELIKLTNLIDWQFLEDNLEPYYADVGRPAIPTRTMVGLHILKYMFDLSDEVVCVRWLENPYYQYFCGEEYFQHDFPIQRSSMTHFRNRVGEDFCIKLVQESLSSAYKCGALKKENLERVVVDTTVQPKAITHPIDSKLKYKAITALVKLAKNNNLKLRQTYLRVGKQALVKSGRYRHAKQMKRANKVDRKIHTWLGRVIRDVERKLLGNDILIDKFKVPLEKSRQIFYQTRLSKNKIYSWHAPEVECISKGKAHKPYEFGCKVSITTNVNKAPGGHFVLHAKALHGLPYDGHTLSEVIEDLTVQTGIEPSRIYVDKGYRGHKYKNKLRVFKSGQKRGITPTIKKELKRRNVVEPIIGHLKEGCRLGRNYLHGELGDKVNALLSACGYNFRQILRWLRVLFFKILIFSFCKNLDNKKTHFNLKWVF